MQLAPVWLLIFILFLTGLSGGNCALKRGNHFEKGGRRRPTRCMLREGERVLPYIRGQCPFRQFQHMEKVFPRSSFSPAVHLLGSMPPAVLEGEGEARGNFSPFHFFFSLPLSLGGRGSLLSGMPSRYVKGRKRSHLRVLCQQEEEEAAWSGLTGACTSLCVCVCVLQLPRCL